jgi:putative phosphoesterase
VKLGGRSIYVLHNLKELTLDPAAAGIDVVVSGHSHRPKIETVGGVVYLNPGSAGPRRFRLPIALATLELTGDAIRPCIHEMGKMPLGDSDVFPGGNARRDGSCRVP